jgi:hypothetical protein
MPTISSRLYEGEKDFQTMLDRMERVRSAKNYPVKEVKKIGTQLPVFE